MKRLLILLLIPFLLLTSCTVKVNVKENETTSKYIVKKNVNHYALEPDKKLVMDKNDIKYYENLMDALLSRKEEVSLSSDKEKNELYLDLLKQSPYFFLVTDAVVEDTKVKFTYQYEKEEHESILKAFDEKLLEIINYNALQTDNELDHMLKIYYYITKNFKYDYSREDNKQLGSERFIYPGDEVYIMFTEGKCICQGFAYLVRFCFLQFDIDCFCVYGQCTAHNEGHMWNIFKYDNQFFTCDAAWDIAETGYSKLMNFGKTENERKVDTLVMEDFYSSHNKEYEGVECTDERFKIFRGIDRYAFIDGHDYYMQDFKNKEKVFNSETFEME